MSETVKTGGWGWPLSASRPHFFDPGAVVSICGKWMYTGERTQDDGKTNKNDCTLCHKALAKRANPKTTDFCQHRKRKRGPKIHGEWGLVDTEICERCGAWRPAVQLRKAFRPASTLQPFIASTGS